MGFKGLIARGPAPEPSFAIYLKGAILVLSIIVLAMSAWGINLIRNPDSFSLRKRQLDDLDDLDLDLDGLDLTGLDDIDFSDFDVPSSSVSSFGGSGGGEAFDAPLIFMLFVIIWTIIETVVIGVFQFVLPQLYFRIGVFVAYIINIILLLSAWAYCADRAADIGKALGGFSGWDYPKKLHGAFGAAAGLGALVWILLIIVTVFFVLASLKSDNSAAPGTQPTQMNNIPAKQETGYGQPAVQPQPAPAYQQPAYQQPQQQQQVPYPS